MNRRAFLKLFAAAGPVAAVAPTYFFAPVGGWDLTARDRAKLADMAKLYRQSWVSQMVERDTQQLREQFWVYHPAQAKAIEELGGFRIYGGSKGSGNTYAQIVRQF